MRPGPAWAWLDTGPRTPPPEGTLVVDLVQNWPLRAPAINLPPGGEAVSVRLERVAGRVREDPAPPGQVPPPLGFDVEEVDEALYRLHPDVLLLPVHVHVIADVDGRVPYFGRDVEFATIVEQMFDMGPVEGVSSGLIDSPFESTLNVVTRSFTDQLAEFQPDPIWTQCDIQFRLQSYEEISQSDNLERFLVRDVGTFCAEVDDDPSSEPLAAHVPPFIEGDGIHVFFGGRIQGGGGEVVGLTCGPSSICWPRNPSGPDFVAIDAAAMRRRPVVLTHELGHFLGLGHQDRTCVPGLDDLPAGNLMTANYMGDAQAATLTGSQCVRARCLAMRWLELWGRLPAGTADAAGCPS